MSSNGNGRISQLRLKGPIAAPFTPFKQDGEINFDIMEEYADKIAAGGVNNVFVNGTTGEGISMTVQERKAAAEKWIALGKTRFQTVIVHVGAANLKDTQELGRHAEEHGASAISTLPPIFFKPSSIEGMVNFLEQVAASAPKTPFFYYHNPTMVGSDAFTMESLVKEIFSSNRIPTLCGMKYSSTDLFQYGRCYALHADSCQFMYGCDEQLLPGISVGVEAFIGSTYNYLGRVANRLFTAFNDGDMTVARKEQFRIQALVAVLKKYGGHAGVNKAIMSLVGPEMGPARSPLHNPSPEERELIRKDLEAEGFFDWIQ
nr:N-acetylneuraminate lyase-like [Lytechinus pictus]